MVMGQDARAMTEQDADIQLFNPLLYPSNPSVNSSRMLDYQLMVTRKEASKVSVTVHMEI